MLLNTCLENIVAQLSPGLSSDIELLISDNASPDDTSGIVQQFIDRGYAINYSRNEQNIGPDRNFGKCFAEASGKYLWVFSDDDFIMPGYLKLIVELLRNKDYGCVHLNTLWYNGTFNYAQRIPQSLDIEVYEDPLQFTDKVNYWFTFITSNIINKSALKDASVVSAFFDTNLVQLSWVLPAVFSNKSNVAVNNQVIACKGNNTGGYGVFDVFGKKFNAVLDKLITKKLIVPETKPVINRHLLQSFFPQYLFNTGKSYKSESAVKKLFPLYWSNGLYWRSIFMPTIKRKYLTLSPIKKAFAKAAYAVNNSGYYRLASNQQREAEQAAYNIKFIGENSYLPLQHTITNGKYISIGCNFNSLQNLTLEAIDQYEGDSFEPVLTIGDNVSVGADVHIACINNIAIGADVMIAGRVYICDYTHGDTKPETLARPVIRRPLISGGPIVIEDNVLIGQGACILSGVTLGKNCVVAPNSVVTKSFPANAVIGGSPARLLDHEADAVKSLVS